MVTTMSERELQDQVIQLARLTGWRVAHFRPARTDKGWRTPMQGDRGFPDLVLARDGFVIFAELKSEKGKLTSSQHGWLDELNAHRVDPGAPTTHQAFIWRPSDFDEIQEVLAR